MAELFPSWTWGDLDLTSEPFLFGFESDLGAPVTATEALAQLLTDGEVEVGDRASNRTLVFTVYVDAGDLLEAAQAEALLATEADRKRNTFTFNPGDGYAPSTVFETFRAQLEFVGDPNAERQGLRRYDVTMKAKPFGLSAAEVTSVAVESGDTTVPPPTPETVVISDGSTTTGWSARIGTLSDVGSALQVTQTRSPRWRYQGGMGGTISLATTPYLSIVASKILTGSTTPGNFLVPPYLLIDGAYAEFVAAQAEPGTSLLRYYWRAPATTGNLFEFGTDFANGTDKVQFYSFKRTNQPPQSGTARQKQRSLEVAGSARTEGSLAIQHETSALGSTLAYSWPAQSSTYSPPLRPLRVSGGTVVVDASLMSGAYDTIDTPLVYDIPVSSLITGTHLLMARVRSNVVSEQGIQYTAQLRIGGADVGASTVGTSVVPFGSAAWRNVILGRLMLPTTDVPAGSSALVRLTIVATAPVVSDIDLDESWLFNTSVGDLTWVECPSSKRLWLNTATVETRHPTIYRGNLADTTDASFPGTDVLAFGAHRFTPPLMNVFSATSGALDAGVSLTHTPAWHTHAAS